MYEIFSIISIGKSIHGFLTARFFMSGIGSIRASRRTGIRVGNHRRCQQTHLNGLLVVRRSAIAIPFIYPTWLRRGGG